MCPDQDNSRDDEQTRHIDPEGPSAQEVPAVDPTIAYAPKASSTVSSATDGPEDETATIATPNDPSSPGTATHGAPAGATEQSTAGGSVPFTPVRDMTSGSLAKAKARPAQGAPPRSVGHRFADRFEVVNVLGEGGMGKVFRVRDTQIDNREMALKVLRPKYSNNQQFRALFTKEIHAAQNFVSEHVVQIRDTGQTADNQLFLTMDMVEGEDLYELLKREGALLPRHAMEIIRQTLLGLHSGHEQGFIHRDIKPSNVMLSAQVAKTDQNPYGVGVQLLDFGIAGIAAEVSGQIAGTPMYMSPEQAQGQRLDVRSDLFTVGVMMFEMLTGTRPFEGKTLDEVVHSILETQLSSIIAELKHLGRPVQKILTRALQKDREKRYQNAQEFIRAIESSKAFKIPSELPAGTAIVLGVSMLAALGQAGYIFTLRKGDQELTNQIASLNSQLGASRSKLQDERDENLKELNENNSEWKKQVDQIKAAKIAVDALLVEKEARINKLLKENSDRGKENSLAYTDSELVKDRLSRLEGDLKKAQQTIKDQGNIISQQGKENKELAYRARPQAKTAEGFDRILLFVARNTPAPARARLDELSNKEGIFSPNGTDGGSLVQHLVAVSEGLYRFDDLSATGSSDAGQLAAAGARLASANKDLDTFLVQSESWINETATDAEPQDRIANLRTVMTMLGEAVEARSAELARSFDAELEEIRNGSPIQDPTRAFELASFADDLFLSQLLGRYSKELTDKFESGGRLQLDKLGALETMGPWLNYFENGPAAAALEPQNVAVLRDFSRARTWYLGTDNERSSLRVDYVPPVARAGELFTDWRAQLAMQMAIHSKGTYVFPAGKRAVYLQTDTSTGSKFWFIASPETAGGSSTGYTHKMRPFTIDSYGGVKPLRAQKVATTGDGWAFHRAGDKVLDLLQAGPEVQVGLWDKLAVQKLPVDGNFPNAKDQAQFKQAFANSPNPCIVETNGDFTGWYSPTYGLVHSKNGNITRDLVYLGS